MSTTDASIADHVMRKLGRAYELHRSSATERESDYWAGALDALLDVVNGVREVQERLTRSDVQEAFAAMEFESRVEEAFS